MRGESVANAILRTGLLGLCIWRVLIAVRGAEFLAEARHALCRRWDWERWEREIDWMALNGINLPLAFTGDW